MPNKVKEKSPIQVNEVTGCYLWRGKLDAYGHPIATGGYFPWDKTKVPGRTYRVQHVAFEHFYGYKAKRVVTTCGDDICINPAHLQDPMKHKQEMDKLMAIGAIRNRITELELLEANVQAMDDPDAAQYLSSIRAEMKQKREEVSRIESKPEDKGESSQEVTPGSV